MGFLDRFAKKKDINSHAAVMHNRLAEFRDTVSENLAGIRQDMEAQRQWVGYLNQVHHWLRHTHDRHKELTRNDLEALKNWVAELHRNARQHENSMRQLEKSVRDISQAHHAYLMELYKKMGELSSRDQQIRSEIMKEVHELVDSRHEEMHGHMEKIRDRVEKMPQAERAQHVQSSLSNPEQKLLNLLMAQSDPVSYGFIAERTGQSINTVRVVMNNLKKRGLIEEHMLPSGVKLFTASNKEKIKKLYNLQVL